MNGRLIGSRFPYIPIGVHVRHETADYEALLDTGFDGAVIVPQDFAIGLGQPDQLQRLELADGSPVLGFVYRGRISMGPLGALPVDVIALGNECLIGRQVSDRFTVILDHGRQIIVEP